MILRKPELVEKKPPALIERTKDKIGSLKKKKKKKKKQATRNLNEIQQVIKGKSIIPIKNNEDFSRELKEDDTLSSDSEDIDIDVEQNYRKIENIIFCINKGSAQEEDVDNAIKCAEELINYIKSSKGIRENPLPDDEILLLYYRLGNLQVTKGNYKKALQNFQYACNHSSYLGRSDLLFSFLNDYAVNGVCFAEIILLNKDTAQYENILTHLNNIIFLCKKMISIQPAKIEAITPLLEKCINLQANVEKLLTENKKNPEPSASVKTYVSLDAEDKDAKKSPELDQASFIVAKGELELAKNRPVSEKIKHYQKAYKILLRLYKNTSHPEHKEVEVNLRDVLNELEQYYGSQNDIEGAKSSYLVCLDHCDTNNHSFKAYIHYRLANLYRSYLIKEKELSLETKQAYLSAEISHYQQVLSSSQAAKYPFISPLQGIAEIEKKALKDPSILKLEKAKEIQYYFELIHTTSDQPEYAKNQLRRAIIATLAGLAFKDKNFHQYRGYLLFLYLKEIALYGESPVPDELFEAALKIVDEILKQDIEFGTLYLIKAGLLIQQFRCKNNKDKDTLNQKLPAILPLAMKYFNQKEIAEAFPGARLNNISALQYFLNQYNFVQESFKGSFLSICADSLQDQFKFCDAKAEFNQTSTGIYFIAPTVEQAIACMQQEKLEDAKKTLDKAIVLFKSHNPLNAEEVIHINKIIMVHIGKIKKLHLDFALNIFIDFYKNTYKDPIHLALLHQKLSEIHVTKQDFQKALTAIQAALEFDPLNHELSFQRAKIHSQLKDFDMAKKVCEEVLAKFPQLNNFQTLLATIKEDIKKANSRNKQLLHKVEAEKKAAEEKKRSEDVTLMLYLRQTHEKNITHTKSVIDIEIKRIEECKQNIRGYQNQIELIQAEIQEMKQKALADFPTLQLPKMTPDKQHDITRILSRANAEEKLAKQLADELMVLIKAVVPLRQALPEKVHTQSPEFINLKKKWDDLQNKLTKLQKRFGFMKAEVDAAHNALTFMQKIKTELEATISLAQEEADTQRLEAAAQRLKAEKSEAAKRIKKKIKQERRLMRVVKKAPEEEESSEALEQAEEKSQTYDKMPEEPSLESEIQSLKEEKPKNVVGEPGQDAIHVVHIEKEAEKSPTTVKTLAEEKEKTIAEEENPALLKQTISGNVELVLAVEKSQEDNKLENAEDNKGSGESTDRVQALFNACLPPNLQSDLFRLNTWLAPQSQLTLTGSAVYVMALIAKATEAGRMDLAELFAGMKIGDVDFYIQSLQTDGNPDAPSAQGLLKGFNFNEGKDIPPLYFQIEGEPTTFYSKYQVHVARPEERAYSIDASVRYPLFRPSPSLLPLSELTGVLDIKPSQDPTDLSIRLQGGYLIVKNKGLILDHIIQSNIFECVEQKKLGTSLLARVFGFYLKTFDKEGKPILTPGPIASRMLDLAGTGEWAREYFAKLYSKKQIIAKGEKNLQKNMHQAPYGEMVQLLRKGLFTLPKLHSSIQAFCHVRLAYAAEERELQSNHSPELKRAVQIKLMDNQSPMGVENARIANILATLLQNYFSGYQGNNFKEDFEKVIEFLMHTQDILSKFPQDQFPYAYWEKALHSVVRLKEIQDEKKEGNTQGRNVQEIMQLLSEAPKMEPSSLSSRTPIIQGNPPNERENWTYYNNPDERKISASPLQSPSTGRPILSLSPTAFFPPERHSVALRPTTLSPQSAAMDVSSERTSPVSPGMLLGFFDPLGNPLGGKKISSPFIIKRAGSRGQGS